MNQEIQSRIKKLDDKIQEIEDEKLVALKDYNSAKESLKANNLGDVERERLNAQLLALQTSIGALNTRLGGFEEDRRNLNKSDPLFLFDHDLVTSLADSEQVELLNNAIKVAEYFINFKKSKETISMKFRVNSNIFSQNLLEVTVEFADWAIWDNTPKLGRVGLSWINKYQIDRIFLNQIFWQRYNITEDQNEQQRIAFILGLCIFHEIGHLSLQWSPYKRYKRVTTEHGTYVVTPKIMNEAGRFFENQVFGNELAVFAKAESKHAWNEDSDIAAVAFKISADDFDIIDQDFISEVLSFSLEHHEISDFRTNGKGKVFPNHIVLMHHNCLDDEAINNETQSATKTTPLKGMVSIPFCGTHLLFPPLDDKTIDGNANDSVDGNAETLAAKDKNF